jgi:hypothetical protein
VQVGVRVVQPVPGAVAQGDPVQGVDHVQEAGEVDLGVVVDGQPGGLLDGPDQQAGAAEGEGGVDLAGPAVDGGAEVPGSDTITALSRLGLMCRIMMVSVRRPGTFTVWIRPSCRRVSPVRESEPTSRMFIGWPEATGVRLATGHLPLATSRSA